MTWHLRILVAALALMLAACTGPKPPPGWPSGEERPINPSHVKKAPP